MGQSSRTLENQQDQEKKSTWPSRIRYAASYSAMRLYNSIPWAPTWLPINSANITGFAFPQTARLQGNVVTGRMPQLMSTDKDAFTNEIIAAGNIAKQDPLGRCYFSVGPWASVQWMFLITRPADWQQVFKFNQTSIARTPAAIGLEYMFPNNVFTLPSDSTTWRTERNAILQSVFDNVALEKVSQRIQDVIDDCMTNLPQQRDINGIDFFKLLAMEVVARTRLGMKSLAKEEILISNSLQHAFDEFTTFNAAARLQFSASIKKYAGNRLYEHMRLKTAVLNPPPELARAKNALHKIFKDYVINPNVANIAEGDNLIWDLAVQQFKQEHATLPDVIDPAQLNFNTAEIISESAFLLLVGHETSATLLTYALMFLAKHPEIAERLRETIVANNNIINRSTVDNNTLLTCILFETLRLMPPVPTLIWSVTKPLTLGALSESDLKKEDGYNKSMQARDKSRDVVLPVGTMLIASQWISQRLEETYGDNAEQFYPDRWSEKVKSKAITLENPFAAGFYPFGVGINKRNCPGRRFALLEAGMAICILIQKYHIELAPGVTYPPEIRMQGTLKSKQPIRFRFFSRHQSDGGIQQINKAEATTNLPVSRP